MEATDLKAVYEDHYSAEDDDAARYGAWRALSAKGKADHVVKLATRIAPPPETVVEIGCGDGALLAELAARGFAKERHGFELSESAAAIAAQNPGVTSAQSYDGERIPVRDGSFDLAILSHVLEHVPDPAATLAEAARVATHVILEVPLEDNRSAKRASKLETHEDIGHLHHFSRSSVMVFVSQAGLEVIDDLTDPLTREAHLFFAATPAAKARAFAKAITRRTIYTLAPETAARTFTLHYAALCTRV